MKHFLQANDMPNWVGILFFLLCYMNIILQEKLERMRREKYERLTGEEHP